MASAAFETRVTSYPTYLHPERTECHRLLDKPQQRHTSWGKTQTLRRE
jgi:hypothetical protein